MSHRNTRHPDAFTLLELLATVVVMCVIGAVLVPVMTSSSEAYTTTRDVRNRTEQAAHALDRMVRVVREAPIGSDATGIGVQSASATSLSFTDGTGVIYANGQLELMVPGQPNALLCDAIDDFRIDYLADDGRTSTLATPGATHRIVFTLSSGPLHLSAVAHPRVWIGQEAP